MSTNDDSLLRPEAQSRQAAQATDMVALREQVTVDAVETIPLPRQRVRAGEAFSVVTDDVTAWPDQRLEWTFEYNQYMGRWIFTCEHDHIGRLFDGKSVATLGRHYSAYPYMLAMFTTPSAESPHAPGVVTAQTLGESVELAVVPGPAGGSFLDAAGVSDDEADALLGRHASDHPVTGEWV